MFSMKWLLTERRYGTYIAQAGALHCRILERDENQAVDGKEALEALNVFADCSEWDIDIFSMQRSIPPSLRFLVPMSSQLSYF